MRTSPPVTAPLFRSEGQARLLNALALGEEKSLTQLAVELSTAYSGLHREIERLLQAGLLKERRVGRTRLVRFDDESPLAAPVRELLLVSVGVVPALAEAMAAIAAIEAVYLYGSFAARLRGHAGPAPNDIDVMVIGTPDPVEVYAACRAVGDLVHRPVNPTIMTPQEAGRSSGFMETVRSNPTVHVLGALP